MSVATTLLAVLILGGAGAGAYLWQQRGAERRHEDFQALAARRGWSLTRTKAALGRPATLRISARSGLGWQAETRTLAPGTDGPGQRRVTEWICDEPRWIDGTLIVGSDLPQGEAVLAAQMLARLDDPKARRMLQKLTGGRLGIEASGIRQIDAPPGLTVMATTNPRLRVDLGDLAKVLTTWAPIGTGDDGTPILILTQAGLRLRLRREIRHADKMEEFIDLALATSRVFG